MRGRSHRRRWAPVTRNLLTLRRTRGGYGTVLLTLCSTLFSHPNSFHVMRCNFALALFVKCGHHRMAYEVGLPCTHPWLLPQYLGCVLLMFAREAVTPCETLAVVKPRPSHSHSLHSRRNHARSPVEGVLLFYCFLVREYPSYFLPINNAHRPSP